MALDFLASAVKQEKEIVQDCEGGDKIFIVLLHSWYDCDIENQKNQLTNY